jgi:hypothetical protein
MKAGGDVAPLARTPAPVLQSNLCHPHILMAEERRAKDEQLVAPGPSEVLGISRWGVAVKLDVCAAVAERIEEWPVRSGWLSTTIFQELTGCTHAQSHSCHAKARTGDTHWDSRGEWLGA